MALANGWASALAVIFGSIGAGPGKRLRSEGFDNPQESFSTLKSLFEIRLSQPMSRRGIDLAALSFFQSTTGTPLLSRPSFEVPARPAFATAKACVARTPSRAARTSASELPVALLSYKDWDFSAETSAAGAISATGTDSGAVPSIRARSTVLVSPAGCDSGADTTTGAAGATTVSDLGDQ